MISCGLESMLFTHVSDGHLEVQEAYVAIAVPQCVTIDGDLGGVDVPSAVVHSQVQ